MYVIIVYDVMPKRGVKVLKFLRQHLVWVQNSVFEGDVTESGLAKIKAGIKDVINEKKDSIILYTFASQNYALREVIGLEKNETDTFI